MAESAKGPIRKKQKKSDAEKIAAIFDPDHYEAHKSAIALVMNHFFLRYLNLLYHEFEGDLVLPMVLGEVAHHNLTRFYSHKGDCIQVHYQDAKYPDRMKHLEPTNAFSISQATGIPRETVRRKIDKLEKNGWLVKNDRGEIFMSETVSDYFTKNFGKQMLSELLETSRCIREMLESDGKKHTAR